MEKIEKTSQNSFDDHILKNYFKRSYFAADGLWFLMIEKKLSSKEALEIDEEVWQVLPKIQAREVKKLLNLKGDGIQNFLKASALKLQAEGYKYKKKVDAESVQFIVTKCPWYDIIKKTNRDYLVPNNVCHIHFQTWAKEFKPDLKVTIKKGLCAGDSNCQINFDA